MPTKYYDPSLSTGDDDGSTEANAWRTLQKAADSAVADDLILCRYTVAGETLSATVDVDVVTGLRFVGVNSSWVEDGTRCTLDANDTAASCVKPAKHYNMFRNFRFINATGAGADNSASNTYNLVYVNCLAEDNGTYGFYRGPYCSFFLDCISRNNGNNGFSSISYGTVMNRCASIGNTGWDLYDFSIMTIMNSVFHDNSSGGMSTGSSFSGSIVNCVVDGNTGNGIYVGNSYVTHISGCRITNNTGYGLVGSSGSRCTYDHCLIVDNPSGAIDDSIAAYVYDLGGNVTTGAAGYVDRDNDNFTTATDAQLRREAVTIG